MKLCLKYKLRGSKVNDTGLESKQRPGLVLGVFTIQAVPVERCSTSRVVRTWRKTTALQNNFSEVTKIEARLLSLKEREIRLLHTHLTPKPLTLQKIWFRSTTCARLYLKCNNME